MFGGKTPLANRVMIDRGNCNSSIGIVIASFGWPPGPVFPSSFSFPFSPPACAGEADDPAATVGVDAAAVLGRNTTASAAEAAPGGGGSVGGGRLGGGIEVSMLGRASADVACPGGAAPGRCGCCCCIGRARAGDDALGGSSSMGAKRAAEAVVEDASLLRGGMAGLLCACCFSWNGEVDTSRRRAAGQRREFGSR